MDILIFDHSCQLSRDLLPALREEGCRVTVPDVLRAGLTGAPGQRFDLAVIDPDPPSWPETLALCARCLRSGAALLLVSSRDSAEERTMALEVGATDYLRKPYDPAELLARVHVQLRWRQALAGSQQAAALVRVPVTDLWTLDVESQCLLGPREVPLASTEFRLLCCFRRHEGQVLSRMALLRQVWGDDCEGRVSPREVDHYVHALREKIEADPRHPRFLLTHHREGYSYHGPRGRVARPPAGWSEPASG